MGTADKRGTGLPFYIMIFILLVTVALICLTSNKARAGLPKFKQRIYLDTAGVRWLPDDITFVCDSATGDSAWPMFPSSGGGLTWFTESDAGDSSVFSPTGGNTHIKLGGPTVIPAGSRLQGQFYSEAGNRISSIDYLISDTSGFWWFISPLGSVFVHTDLYFAPGYDIHSQSRITADSYFVATESSGPYITDSSGDMIFKDGSVGPYTLAQLYSLGILTQKGDSLIAMDVADGDSLVAITDDDLGNITFGPLSDALSMTYKGVAGQPIHLKGNNVRIGNTGDDNSKYMWLVGSVDSGGYRYNTTDNDLEFLNFGGSWSDVFGEFFTEADVVDSSVITPTGNTFTKIASPLTIAGAVTSSGSNSASILYSNNSIYADFGNNGLGIIYFYETTPSGRSLRWDQTDQRFEFNDSVFISNGISATGIVDFGSATSLEVPNSSNPATTIAGHIAFDTNDSTFEFFQGATSRLLPTAQYLEFTVKAPDGVNDTVTIMHITDLLYPAGIKLLRIDIITNDSAGTYDLQIEEWTGKQNRSRAGYIDTIQVKNDSSYARSETFSDADIAAENDIRGIIPSTVTDEIHVGIGFYIKDNN